ncbi:MAG TPA: hypothetical protein VLI89_03445 [Burkholderiales bacterium]|jgi:hypothetical protein|nr:hypothetical protein [Burkholderiales bacterium]
MTKILAIALAAAAIGLVYGTQRPAPAAEPLPAAQGDVPQIVIVAKRWDAADSHR